MSNPTSNFGWQMPTNSDLVTDLPADFEVFGQAVDTSMADLKGGTSGQILSKATNADMDFVWINNDQGDITGVTATSPLTGGGTSGAITVGIQAASTTQSGAVQLTDSTSSTSTTTAATPNSVKSAYDPAFTNNFYAGKNKIINGDFGIWQRGTTVSNPNGTYLADRFYISNLTAVPTSTYSQQTFTPGTAPVAGYEGQYFMRFQVTSQGTSTGQGINTKIEDVRVMAGQTVTFSFWAKAAANLTMNDIKFGQNFGSGGSAAVESNFTFNSKSVTTSWQRFTGTVTVPSVSGKTIGTSSYVYIYLEILSSQGAYTFDTWGWQLEAGSTATPFQTATGTKQGELAACQRYYYRNNSGGSSTLFATGFGSYSTTNALCSLVLPVPMRITPTAIDTSGTASNYRLYNGARNIALSAVPAISASDSSNTIVVLAATVASGLTTGDVVSLTGNGTTSAYIGLGAEL